MKRKNKQHKKPTKPFGSIAFGKNGSVKPHITNLSSDKQTQENEAIHIFFEGIQRTQPSFKVNGIKRLPEPDNDFLIDTYHGEIVVELTELVDLEFTHKLSEEEYRRGGYRGYVQKEPGGIPWGIDFIGQALSLKKRIEGKIEENYSKPDEGEFWLVIFCVSFFDPPEYHKDGITQKSAGLLIAQDYLKTLPSVIFDQIWYTDLETNPTKIWPC